MSIRSRIKSIENHLSNAYNSITNLGLYEDNTNKNMENISPLLDEFYDKVSDKTDLNQNGVVGRTSQETITEEAGTNVINTSIYIDDVNTDKEHIIELKGNTSQNTTTGKNLFNKIDYQDIATTRNGNVTNVTKTSNSISYKSDGNNNFSGVYISTANIKNYVDNYDSDTTYCISADITVDKACKFGSLQTTTDYADIPVGTTRFSVYSKVLNTINFYVRNAVTDGVNVKIENIMVTTTNDSDYEPYTYGASPNPSYPQNIDVVTGNNNVNICGKNLFNPTYEVETQYDVSGNIFRTNRYTLNNNVITIDKSNNSYGNTFFNKIYLSTGTYTFSCNVSQANNTTSQARLKIQDWTNSSSIVASKSVDISSGKVEQTFEVSSNAEIGIMLIPNQNSDGTLYLSSIQLEENSTATTYEQYQETTYPVNLGNIELCKIDTYQDRIYKQNDKWYLEKNVGKETDDGSSDEPWGKLNREINGCYGFRHNGLYSEILLCDKLTNYTAAQLFNGIGEGIGFSPAGNYLAVYIKSERVNSYDVTALRAFLANNPITFYYQLSTPTTTEITDTTLISQLNALRNSDLYSITNINTVTSNLLPYIDLQYNVVTPAPSPERPSEVQNLSGDILYNITGKNLLDIESYLKQSDRGITPTYNQNGSVTLSGTATANYSNFVENIFDVLEKNKTYTLSVTGTKNFAIGCRLFYSDNTNEDFNITSANTYVNITPTKDVSNFRIYMYSLTSGTSYNSILYFQLEKGSTATSYEPYISRTYQIKLGNIELCKINTYEDKIYSNDGKFYLEKNIDKKFENSFTNILPITSTLANNLYGYACGTQNLSSYSELGAIISNIFVPKILGSQTDTTNPNNVRFNMGITKHPNTNQVVITIDKKYLDTGTTTEFSNFLNNNDFEYYCVLATPTVTEITSDNYPELYESLKQIQDYLVQYKINNEFILDYSSPNIEY